MKDIIHLIRPKDWAKNLFLFVPLFFAGRLFEMETIKELFYGFLCFCAIASAVYIINDYRDIEFDKLHPEKSSRPLASGKISKPKAVILAILLIIAGFTGAWFIRDKFMFVLALYFLLNLAYSFGLKNLPIVDIVIIAIGFVLRIKAGAVIAKVGLTEWLTIMVFLLALFMALAKRRDDVILKNQSGMDMRKAVKGYNLQFINVGISLISSIIIVSYIMYTMSNEVQERIGTYRIYYTALFVIMGLFRYLQLVYVDEKSQSPTKILYKDRFIQVCLILWIVCFYVILYIKDFSLFET
ncbi:MAG: decaprenyl-phosphate phosphoribosyltransferase [Chitinophagaceae bacterium]|jgi:4-hydroxybenzoate polyprenyltransferase|nr:decaprenyl-phosphate phosphoribosyltransferase [Chitinophagaceae bacterium]MBP6047674.1 decaprenyl-phosphate phosphoribosyltransferase [Ferruginibacter sp.]MBK7088163.1 decaprenyl-phosphate phosphoribosyltransferase [Chitinophagaceae bacterium]MBK7346907.1 decaprenyl-phosphate phosphoribosyltransferase [Chitinophagaceae bacterium]MBK7735179.1 decaprenyl-phosphate phosphoribosyltransferase [Chitinophagaceae bacterium]